AGRLGGAHGRGDLLGGSVRAARRVHPHDDGLDVVVLRGRVDRLGHLVGVDGRTAGQRVGYAVVAGDDRTFGLDDRDGLAAGLAAPPVVAQVVVEFHQ